MTLLAVSTGIAILAWIGLALLLVVALLVVALFNRIVRPALEIKSYADDILVGANGIARNTEAVGELAKARDLATALPAIATAYLEVVKRRL